MDTLRALAGAASDAVYSLPSPSVAIQRDIPQAIERNLPAIAELILGMMPGSGNAMAVRDAADYSGRTVQSAREGRYGDAAGNAALTALLAAGALPMVPGFGGVTKAAGPTGVYVRNTRTPDSPIYPTVGYGMFAKAEMPTGPRKGYSAEDLASALDTYGGHPWVADGAGSVDVAEIQKDIVRALREARAHEEYGTTAAQLAREAAPPDIVNSAGLWDNPGLVEIIWNRVLEPNDITSVRTPDGLLIFDPSLAKPYQP
jgi:hypothetical protein